MPRPSNKSLQKVMIWQFWNRDWLEIDLFDKHLSVVIEP